MRVLIDSASLSSFSGSDSRLLQHRRQEHQPETATCSTSSDWIVGGSYINKSEQNTGKLAIGKHDIYTCTDVRDLLLIVVTILC